MIISISSQPLGGRFKNSNFQQNLISTFWNEEGFALTDWKKDLSFWWRAILTQELEFLLTEDKMILEVEGGELIWSDDFNNISTVWVNA